MKIRFIRALLAGITTVAIALLTLFSVLAYGPSIEQRWMPVLTDFKVVDAYPITKEGVIVVHGNMLKNRSCAFAGAYAVLTDVRGVSSAPIPVELIKKDALGYYRITGRLDWGPWTISNEPRIPYPTRITITGYHDCHPLYRTPNILVDKTINNLGDLIG